MVVFWNQFIIGELTKNNLNRRYTYNCTSR